MVTDDELARRQAAFARKNRTLGTVVIVAGLIGGAVAWWCSGPSWLACVAVSLGLVMRRKADPTSGDPS